MFFFAAFFQKRQNRFDHPKMGTGAINLVDQVVQVRCYWTSIARCSYAWGGFGEMKRRSAKVASIPHRPRPARIQKICW